MTTSFSITGEACGVCWSATLELIKVLMVELMRCRGYFRRENTDFKRSHSSEKEIHDEDNRWARSSIVVKSETSEHYIASF